MTKAKERYESEEHWVVVSSKDVEKGESAGHPFRGNQWTKGRSNTSEKSQVERTASDLTEARWKSYDVQKQNLTDGEKRALEDYTRISHQNINAYLRGKLDKESLSYDKAKSDVKYMDSVFEKSSVATETAGTVYRGVITESKKVSDSWESKLKVGSIVTDKGFVSTSESVETAHSFSRNDYFVGVLYEIKIPAKTKILGGSESESEVILNRGTQMKVTNVTVRERELYVGQPWLVKVELEVIP